MDRVPEISPTHMLGGVEVFRNSHQRPDDAVTSPLSGIGSLLAERLSYTSQIEGVARHAGVGKQTNYRWWKSKPELVL